LDTLEQSLLRAGQYNKNDQCPPAAILWPDKERQWEPLLPALRTRFSVNWNQDHGTNLDGSKRVNERHVTRVEKLAAREKVSQ
jgi:hypothetical protein